MRRFIHRLRSILFRRRYESEIAEEFESHLALHVSDNVRQGMTPEKALREAKLKFGGIESAKEAYRDGMRLRWLEESWQDVHFATRLWRRSPGFMGFALFTLALGIGASVAIFSVIDPLLFKALPYPNDRELVSFGYFGPIDNNEFAIISSYLDWRSAPGPLAEMTSMRPGTQCDLLVGDTAQLVPCVGVEANFLRLLRVTPMIGRNFDDSEDIPGGPPVGIISHRLWQGAFGGDPGILGRSITVESGPLRIIGVLPAGFEMPQTGDADILRPAALNTKAPRPANSSGMLRTFGRLSPGISTEEAVRQMATIMRATASLDVPKELQTEITYVLRSLRDRRIRDVKNASWMLLGAVLALLAISCSNVANLLIARGAARSRELAVRAAIGASYGRLIRQSLAESLLLGTTGCAAGCALGWLLSRAFTAFAPQGLLQLNRAAFDGRVLSFAIFVSLACILLFGLLPALQRHTREATVAFGRSRMRKVLVGIQVALAVILLTGASLLLKSLVRIESNRLGFEPAQVITASFTLRQPRYNMTGAQAAFAREMEARMQAIVPDGVFALTDSIPPRGSMGRPYSNLRVEGRPPLSGNGGIVAFRSITPDYFRVLQIPVLAGRAFTEADRSAAEDPIILSASLAKKIFGTESALQHRLLLSSDDTRSSVIVGVVADAHNNGVTEPVSPEYYRLRMTDGRQAGRTTVALFRTSIPTDRMVSFIRRELSALDPALPVEIGTLAERVRGFTERPRFLAALVASFAALGLLLSAAGLYGVLSLLVTQRTREIGIRVAIGAKALDIAWLIQRQALAWTLGGLSVGLIISLSLVRYLRSVLFEISPYDPASIGIATAATILATTAAAWSPVFRAVRVDPSVSLRSE